MRARAKERALLPNRQTEIVRSTRTDGTIRKVTVACFLDDHRLRGADARANCGTGKSRHDGGIVKALAASQNVLVSVEPTCSIGLKVSVTIIAKAKGKNRTTWKRTWIVKNAPPIHCAVTATG